MNWDRMGGLLKITDDPESPNEEVFVWIYEEPESPEGGRGGGGWGGGGVFDMQLNRNRQIRLSV